MASKNSVKIYVKNGSYHLYNRGVEKRNIFIDEQDFSVFLNYLREYLEFKDTQLLYEKLTDDKLNWAEKERIHKVIRLNNFFDEIELISYCLMPNHFHLLIKQNKPESIDTFMNSLLTRYASYFNRKYQRIGRLFQDVYKAVLVDSEEQLLHLSRYIHNNPLELRNNARDHQSKYTSLPEYLNKRNTNWIKPKVILGYFSKTGRVNSYLSFMEQNEDLELIKDFILETL